MSILIKAGYMSSAIIVVVVFIVFALALLLTKRGVLKPRIRRLPGVDAIDEFVGRATELGRPVHFTLGIGAVSNPQSIAGLAIAKYIAKKCAEYNTPFLFTFADYTIQIVAPDLLKEAYIEAGKPDDYKIENVRWLTDRQFAYATGVMGLILREKVAANFILGYFAAESLIISEAGFRTGAAQVAGTTNSYQIPFFVTTCDYTLISEELFTAGAYISKEPIQIGTIAAQDYVRLIALFLMTAGSILFYLGIKALEIWLRS